MTDTLFPRAPIGYHLEIDLRLLWIVGVNRNLKQRCGDQGGIQLQGAVSRILDTEGRVLRLAERLIAEVELFGCEIYLFLLPLSSF